MRALGDSGRERGKEENEWPTGRAGQVEVEEPRDPELELPELVPLYPPSFWPNKWVEFPSLRVCILEN